MQSASAKARVRRWREAPDTQRQRCVAAAIASAEPSWKNAVGDPAALERLSLAVLASRHSDVTLQVERTASDRGLVVTTLESGDQGAVYRTLDDLRAWARRNGRSLDVPDQVIERVPRPERLRKWFERETTGRTSRHARARQRPKDALATVCAAADDRLAVPLAEAALTAAPDVVGLPARELKEQAAKLWVARDGLRATEAAVQAWWKGNLVPAARQIALARARATADPVTDGQAAVLGEQRASWLRGEAAYQGGLIAGAPRELLERHEQQIGAPLAGLDQAATLVADAGRAVAANRELDRREQLQRVQQEVAEHGPPAAEVAARRADALPLDRYRRGLGERRYDLLQRYARALVPQVAELDAATRQQLRAEIGDPWREFDPGSAMRSLGQEQRERPAVIERREELLRERGTLESRARTERRGSVAKAARAQAQQRRGEAWKEWQTLGEIEQSLAAERARDGSLDRFIAEHPEAALDHALQEVERRQELEAPARAAPEAPAIAAAPTVEMAM